MATHSSPTMARNLQIRRLMGELLAQARAGTFQIDAVTRLKLHQVCATNVWGFREVLLVMCIGRLLDPQYSPTSNFYGCNPRAIYEGPIREALYEAGIPHGKSGPLNVAKAAAGINEAWAAQRRPREVARVVVELAQRIEQASSSEVRGLTTALLAELLTEAKRVAGYVIQVPREADVSRLVNLCWKMMDEVPDAGNTPQRIVGLLLEAYHEHIESNVKVTGHKERASVTSTTSKKPGDIMEESASGKVLAVYEVTVKPFDEQRASDSHEAVQAFARSINQSIPEVTVVCRDEDVHPSATWAKDSTLNMATLDFRGVRYQFIEIHHWVASVLNRLAPEARVKFYTRLNDYVSEPSTSERVKAFWRQLHEEEVAE